MSIAINHAAAIKRLETLFNDVKLESKTLPSSSPPPPPPPLLHVEVEKKPDAKCDVHGKNGRRSSVDPRPTPMSRKNSTKGVHHQPVTRKNSAGNGYQKRDLVFGGGMGPRRDSMPVLGNYMTYYNR